MIAIMADSVDRRFERSGCVAGAQPVWLPGVSLAELPERGGAGPSKMSGISRRNELKPARNVSILA
jgi:hypothetical protein